MGKKINGDKTMKKLILISLIFLLLISIVSAQEEKFKIIIISSPTCPHCAKLKAHINELIELHGEKIELIELTLPEDLDAIIQIQEDYGVPVEERGLVPKAFLVGEYCVGDTPCIDLINEKLDEFLKGQPINGNGNGEENGENGKEPVQINIWQMVGLAAVDAVNPCTLAVLVILMTAILARYPKEKEKALHAGLLFTLAVILMYFIFGVLIIYGFKSLLFLTSLSGTWFYRLLGILAIILGAVNLKDAIWYGGGGFVMEVPHRWRPKMKSILKGTTSVKGAFFVGLIVSFFLTPCTSGPYFVAGGILAPFSFIAALPYLFLYLLVFGLPMLAITGAVYFGFLAVENISEWREKNIKLLHLVAAVILIALGVAMITGII